MVILRNEESLISAFPHSRCVRRKAEIRGPSQAQDDGWKEAAICELASSAHATVATAVLVKSDEVTTVAALYPTPHDSIPSSFCLFDRGLRVVRGELSVC